jgi:dephospho-CoA kinase
MMGAQLDAASKRQQSDYVIDNDGDLEKLELNASTVWKSLATRA